MSRPARTQDAADERDPGSAAEPRPEPTLHGELRLSLADAIAMSLENNLDVEIARYAPIIALQDHEIAWGAYDPNLNLEYGYSWIETPVVNRWTGSPEFRDSSRRSEPRMASSIGGRSSRPPRISRDCLRSTAHPYASRSTYR
jgi:outer membrane protein TolC